MSQSNQQDAAPAKPKAGKRWEWFWRIIAGLMLIVIAWVVWVLYQITPRSVVTPLAYESSAKPIGTQPTPAGASPPAISSISAVQAGAAVAAPSQRTTEAAAADLAMEQAQTAARAGAHQASADVQAATLEKKRATAPEEGQVRKEGLKLSTEITTPMAEKKRIPGAQEGKPGSN